MSPRENLIFAVILAAAGRSSRLIGYHTKPNMATTTVARNLTQATCSQQILNGQVLLIFGSTGAVVTVPRKGSTRAGGTGIGSEGMISLGGGETTTCSSSGVSGRGGTSEIGNGTGCSAGSTVASFSLFSGTPHLRHLAILVSMS